MSKAIMSFLRYGKHKGIRIHRPASGWVEIDTLATVSDVDCDDIIAIAEGSEDQKGKRRFQMADDTEGKFYEFIRPTNWQSHFINK